MRPDGAVNYPPDRHSRNAVLASQRSEAAACWCVERADGSHLPGRQFGSPVVLTVWGSVATLGHLVGNVIGVGAQEQVIGSDTRGVVAMVQYPHSFRDWPICVRVHPAVRGDRATFTAAGTKATVAFGETRALPFPATIVRNGRKAHEADDGRRASIRRHGDLLHRRVVPSAVGAVRGLSVTLYMLPQPNAICTTL